MDTFITSSNVKFKRPLSISSEKFLRVGREESGTRAVGSTGPTDCSSLLLMSSIAPAFIIRNVLATLDPMRLFSFKMVTSLSSSMTVISFTPLLRVTTSPPVRLTLMEALVLAFWNEKRVRLVRDDVSMGSLNLSMIWSKLRVN